MTTVFEYPLPPVFAAAQDCEEVTLPGCWLVEVQRTVSKQGFAFAIAVVRCGDTQVRVEFPPRVFAKYSHLIIANDTLTITGLVDLRWETPLLSARQVVEPCPLCSNPGSWCGPACEAIRETAP